MCRVLIIEDNEILREVVQRMLVVAGHEVQAAEDGRAGLKAYRRQPSDVVITDIVMPDTEGLETIRELCRIDAAVKIIAMSGGGLGASANYLELARQFGARWTLSKPFSADELRNAVTEATTERGDGPG
jgi:CheY-like chemotaxis protein